MAKEKMKRTEALKKAAGVAEQCVRECEKGGVQLSEKDADKFKQNIINIAMEDLEAVYEIID